LKYAIINKKGNLDRIFFVMMGFGGITISTSDSLDIDNTYIETPTVTAIPANIILVRTLM
jgi:hypothetical protein